MTSVDLPLYFFAWPNQIQKIFLSLLLTHLPYMNQLFLNVLFNVFSFYFVTLKHHQVVFKQCESCFCQKYCSLVLVLNNKNKENELEKEEKEDKCTVFCYPRRHCCSQIEESRFAATTDRASPLQYGDRLNMKEFKDKMLGRCMRATGSFKHT